MRIEDIEKFLLDVQKPARYIGGEMGSIVKDFDKASCKVAFCFPDTYEIGMSHLGMKILYHMINEREDSLCERVFAPWIDMEEKMRSHNIPLYSLENKKAVSDFDLVGFTLQYEMCYTNVLNMLDLANIPLLSKERTDGPFVCVGGPCSYNSEPLADFVDFVMLGEGEEIFNEVIDQYVEWKNNGEERETFLERIAKLDGIYVPKYYDVTYHADGTVEKIAKNRDFAADRPQKRIIHDMSKAYYPETLVVPFTEIVHDRIMLEIFRGCTRGCRFCQAGMIYRPVREKSVDRITELAEKLIKNTGYDEMSLSSLSTSDYSKLEEMMSRLLEVTQEKKVSLSLPSLRVDNFSMDLMKKVQAVRKTGLTFAPEAGTQRLRDVINKGVTENDLMNSSALAFSNGWNTVKLYFMMGLPTETMEDVMGIGELAEKVVDCYYNCVPKGKNRGVKVTVSTSVFVPKPFTPFQWDPQEKIASVVEKQQNLKHSIRKRQIVYNWHESKVSYLEAVFARGDRNLCKVLLKAHEMGCKFDGWDETFSFERWMDVFKACGVDPDFYATRKREFDEILPWSHIDVGVSEAFLKREREKAEQGITTPDCRKGCTGCGAIALGGGHCV
ncbi:MAG: TIGR03960 family B12-binding radical SAM protein [Clostridia bacterium]|nr:TIGR03960 family B12-binding radical SAM protein [Clostridia bacterium]